jgi:uncharacterized protein (TIGR02598 family)
VKVSAANCLQEKKLRAFSLVEIVLALGIISFAIVGIMALFPAAMHSAQESQRETRAAFIARQIFSDLKTRSGTNTFVADTSNVLAPGIKVNLASNAVVELSFDGDGIPVPVSENPLFKATVSVIADDPVPGISRVQTSVRSTTASSNSPPYTFVSLLPGN